MAQEIGALATIQCSAKTRDNLKTVFDIAVNVRIRAACNVVCVGIKVLSRERLYYSLICVIGVFIAGCVFICKTKVNLFVCTLPRIFCHFAYRNVSLFWISDFSL